MKRTLIQIVTVIMAVIMFALIAIYMQYPHLHVYALRKQIEYSDEKADRESVLELVRRETEIAKDYSDVQTGAQLRLELARDIESDDISISNDYVNQRVDIDIKGADKSYIYDYPIIGRSDNIRDIICEQNNSECELEIYMDDIYVVDLSVTDDYVYIDFVEPDRLFDNIVVIDAGHGGEDSGAVVNDIREKDIDLNIVNKIRTVYDGRKHVEADENETDYIHENIDIGKFDQTISSYESNERSIGVFYTRTEDTGISAKQRVDFANSINADLFISVHNNSTASGRMSAINGTAVMYHAADDTGLSRQFAQTCLDSLVWNLGSTSKGIIAGDDIYIIRNADMPVALAEVGFMTNEDELGRLVTDEYQQKAAEAVCRAIDMTDMSDDK